MLGLTLALVLQADAELADRLVRRGWIDLAESLYQQSPGAEGALGRARLKLAQAEREDDPVAFEAAAVLFRAFVRDHGPAEDALSDLSLCLKAKGRLLRIAGPFEEAEALFKGETIFAKHELGLVLLSRGLALKSPPHLHRVIELFLKELSWLVDGTALQYELQVQAGRAWQMLAELGAVERDWEQCFVCFSNGRGALAHDVAEAQEIGARATLLEMRARVRHGTSKSLLEAVKRGDEYARRKRKPGGHVLQLIRLEHGKALGLAGRVTQAVTLLQALRAETKGSPVESAALDLLAEFAGHDNPKIALDAADDLLERGEVLKALVNYHRAAVLLRGRAEEARCWLGTGTCYGRLGRYREAVAAFTKLEEIKAATVDSRMLKLAALRRLKEMTKDPADAQAYAAHRATLGGDDSLIEEEALELESQGNYKGAASKWASMKSDRALYRAARATYLQPDHAAALALFRQHLAKAPASPEAFRATVYAARCLTVLGKPDEALAIAEGAEAKWPSAEPAMLQWLILQRVQAKAAQGKPAEAESDVAAIERIWKKEQVGIDYLGRALVVAAEAWEKAAKDDAAWERAARLWHRHFEINPPDPKKDGDRLEQIAGKLVEIAPRVKEAKELWSMARDLYAQRRATMRDGSDAIRRLEAKCLVGMGRFEEGVEALRELAAADPGMVNGALWEELADAYQAWGRSLELGSTRTETLRKALDIYGKLSSALRRVEGPHYWRVTYSYAQCLWETDLESLRDFFSDMTRRGYAETWDSGAFKPKFEALQAKLKEKLPGRK